jgi:hypothetical protein
MQKSIILLLVGCAAYTNAVETSSLRTKLKGLAQLSALQDSTLPDCNLTAPELGDLSGDLLDWCPDQFGAGNVSLGAALTAAAS